MSIVRAAVVQANPIVFDREATIEKVRNLVKEAANQDDPENVLMRGGSCIVGPLGEVLARPDFNGPTILRADLDLNKIPEGKYDLDTPGHYARPDVFQLQVNLRKQDTVTAWDTNLKDPFKN